LQVHRKIPAKVLKKTLADSKILEKIKKIAKKTQIMAGRLKGVFSINNPIFS